MNFKIKDTIIAIIKWLIVRLHFVLDLLSKESYSYQDLAPISNIEKVDPKGKYRKSLDYAIKNKEIRNIAITGSYGSGKSSLIKSYIDFGILNKNKYLIITMSTFENKENYTNEPIKEIEASILEQIIYRNEEESHRYSKLNRINEPKRKKLIIDFIKILFLIVSVASIVSKSFRSRVLEYFELFEPFFRNNDLVVTFFTGDLSKAVVITIILFINLFILFGFFRYFRSLAKITMKFDKIEFEVNKSDNSSLFDKYIDEIYNFFKHNNYEVVIIEDLDRFQNIDIFERLKRINRLLNSSNAILGNGRIIKFIYAIGDHMFKDNGYKERTKFFDFVIPVIPVIDSTNSYYEIRRTFRNLESGVPNERLLKDASFFIDDMRTLKNIVNEYTLLYGLLFETEKDVHFPNKIFSIACFKNRYPQEYADLQENKGEFNDLIQFYKDSKNQSQKELEKSINSMEIQLQESKNELAADLEELDDLYRLYLSKKIGNRNSTNVCVFYNERNINIKSFSNKDQVLSEANIKNLMNSEYYIVNGTRYDIHDFITLGGRSLSYPERVLSIELRNTKKCEEYLTQLEDLRTKRREIVHLTLADLIKQNESDKKVSDFKEQFPLLFYFVYNKYIAEDYKRYLGFFKEGHMTKNDLEFISSVKSRQVMESDFAIDNPKEIRKELVLEDLKSIYILNFKLIKYLLDSDDDSLMTIIDTFYENKKDLIKFVDGYLGFVEEDLSKENSGRKLLQLLYNRWDNFWIYLKQNEETFQNREIGLLQYALISVLDEFCEMKNSNDELIKEAIENFPNLDKVVDYIGEDKVIKAFEKFEVEDFKIKNFQFATNPSNKYQKLIRFIYENSHYELNLGNIMSIINMTLEVKKDDYSLQEIISYLKDSANKHLKNYIEDNGKIIIGVLSQEFNGIDLDSDSIEYLLNEVSKDVKEVNTVLSILNESSFVKNINSVNPEYWINIVDKNKVQPLLSNVVTYIEANGVDDYIYEFIERNSENLKGDMSSYEENMKDALYQILRFNRCHLRVMTMIKEILNGGQINISEINPEKESIEKIFKAQFNVDLDAGLVSLLDNNSDLKKKFIISYSENIINGEIKISIQPDIIAEIIRGKELTVGNAVKLLLLNESDTEYLRNSLDLFIERLNKRQIIDFIKMAEGKNTKTLILIKYLEKVQFDHNFVIECIQLIDTEYEVFTKQSNFAIEGNELVEELLRMLEGEFVSSFKRQDNGKLRVYLKS